MGPGLCGSVLVDCSRDSTVKSEHQTCSDDNYIQDGIHNLCNTNNIAVHYNIIFVGHKILRGIIFAALNLHQDTLHWRKLKNKITNIFPELPSANLRSLKITVYTIADNTHSNLMNPIPRGGTYQLEIIRDLSESV